MVRSLTPARLRKAAPMFAALGDPTRLGLVARLTSRGPDSIARLSSVFDVSRQAITKHLRVLEGAGLATSSKRGREQIWELNRERLMSAREFLAEVDAQWDATLARLKKFVEE